MHTDCPVLKIVAGVAASPIAPSPCRTCSLWSELVCQIGAFPGHGEPGDVGDEEFEEFDDLPEFANESNRE